MKSSQRHSREQRDLIYILRNLYKESAYGRPYNSIIATKLKKKN